MSERLSIGLAPMEGVTDFATRLWFALVSAPEFSSSPFVRVTDTYPKRGVDANEWPELDYAYGRLPYQFSPQIMAKDWQHFARVAQYHREKTDFLELNCGCPAPKVVGGGAGSSLLKQAEQFHAFVMSLADAMGPRRLAVKMRTGFASDEELPQLIDGIRDAPLRGLCIHGRTRQANYSGEANWQAIAAAAEELPYPLTGSGDIVDSASLRRRLQIAPRVRRIIIGRGALRNPWIFQELRSGEQASVSRETVILALASFVGLQTLHRHDPSTLKALVLTGMGRACYGTDEQLWRAGFRTIADALGKSPSPMADWELAPHQMGRAKMMWNYLRSSLPSSAMQPRILRHRNWSDFISGIAEALPDEATLTHQAAHDWIYAGSKHKQAQEQRRSSNPAPASRPERMVAP